MFKDWPLIKKLIWLKATVLSAASAVLKTVTGSIIHITDALAKPAEALTISIEPQQSGSGDPSPDNVRPISGWSECKVWDDPKYGGVIRWNQKFPKISDSLVSTLYDFTGNNDGSITVTVKTADAISGSNNPFFGLGGKIVGHKYIILSGNDKVKLTIKQSPWPISDTIFTASAAGSSNISIVCPANSQGEYTLYPLFADLTEMFGAGNEPSTVEEFKALFPKDYYPYDDSYTETCVSAVNGDPYRHVTIPFGQTVYGGTLDLTTGVLTVTHGNISSYNGEAINEPWISSMDVYSPGAAPTTGAQVVYPLAMPQTYQLTPTQVEMLLGENNLWADAGDVTLTYYADGRADDVEALNLLLGGRYTNTHEADEPSDREALDIILGRTDK